MSMAVDSRSTFGSNLIGAVIGIMRASPRPTLNIPAMIYVQGFRNVPLLILVFWAYFVPPAFGMPISKFLSVLIALTLFTGAYIAEIVQGGIRSVAPANVEAARTLGLGPGQIQR